MENELYDVWIGKATCKPLLYAKDLELLTAISQADVCYDVFRRCMGTDYVPRSVSVFVVNSKQEEVISKLPVSTPILRFKPILQYGSI